MLSIAFHPTGKWLATSCGGAMLQIWNVESGELVHTYQEDAHSQIWQVLFNPHGKWLVAVDRNVIYL